MPSADKKLKKRVEKARKLIVHAPSAALAADVAAGREFYPSHLMQLSACKTLNAEPKTLDNYNPTGERGEHRYTPKLNVAEEDKIDGMSPADAERESEGWPSSCGTVVNAGSVMRDAMRLNRSR